MTLSEQILAARKADNLQFGTVDHDRIAAKFVQDRSDEELVLLRNPKFGRAMNRAAADEAAKRGLDLADAPDKPRHDL
jgi:hypothetical protein